jgi:hypothetical protein
MGRLTVSQHPEGPDVQGGRLAQYTIITYLCNKPRYFMSLYSYVASTIEGLEIGQMTSIPVPDKLKAFRKFLSEIASRQHRKYTTKVVGQELHILRVPFYSVPQTLESNG